MQVPGIFVEISVHEVESTLFRPHCKFKHAKKSNMVDKKADRSLKMMKPVFD